MKIRKWLDEHEKLYELLRYLIAGGLTTVLSILLHYGMCFLLADRPAFAGSGFADRIRWAADCVNLADAWESALASVVSWVLSVLFAFFINRGMVFRAKGSGRVWTELAGFAGGRVVSYLVFELGLMELLKALGMKNILNRLITTVLVMVFNYIVSKFFVFKEKKAE